MHRDMYDVVLVSPRNYFLYTPLLPAVAAGAMEERSIVEPVRNLMHNKVLSKICLGNTTRAKNYLRAACFAGNLPSAVTHILAPILPFEISTAATVCLPSVLACVLS